MVGVSSASKRYRPLGAALLLVAVIWGFVFLYSVHAVMPTNPLGFPLETQIDLGRFVPQRWEFFTRPPTEADSTVFVQTSEKRWRRIDLGPSLRDWFGFGRTGLGLITEMGLLTSTKEQISTSPCEGPVSDCFDQVPVSATLHNVTPNPFFCGELGVALVAPRPWEEIGSSTAAQPVHVARLSVTC